MNDCMIHNIDNTGTLVWKKICALLFAVTWSQQYDKVDVWFLVSRIRDGFEGIEGLVNISDEISNT